MDMDFYGLSAEFSFSVDPKSRTDLGWVRSQLGGIETAVESVSKTLDRNNIASQFTVEANQTQRATRKMGGAVEQMADALKAATRQIDPLRREFRALRAESRNINFGDLTDTDQFQQATREVKTYIAALRNLESQIQGTTTAEREFGAVLKQQQAIAQTRIDLMAAERKAAIASQNLGSAQALQSVGQSVLGTLTKPIQEAQELQQGLGTIKKLAGDISDRGLVEIKNNILNLSAAMGVADSQISLVFEDLAGAGKDFSDAIDPKTGRRAIEDRIAEVNQIIKNKSALDITTGAATELNITLGSIYKKSLPNYQGGIVELNARAASSINDLTDRLQDVRISAEDVIPVMRVVMNVVGDAQNFPVDQIAAYSAAISALGTVEPEAAGSFFNRLGTLMSGDKYQGAFIENLGYGTKEAFGQAIDTDKLGVLVNIVDRYKNMQGGELEKGGFLASLGIKSAQDQKLIQGLASNLEVLVEARQVAAKGFQGAAGEDLSVQAEFNRVMQTASFQSERFNKAVDALKHTLGLAIQDALTPMMEALSNIIGFTLTLTQKFPGLTKAIAIAVTAFGGLAAAAGTAGVVLFGLEQAGAVASVAMISMERSLLPLTGFFQTAESALAGTNPLETFFRQNTKLASDFGRAATGNFEETTIGLKFLGRQAYSTGQAFLLLSRSIVLSPLGITVGSFILLNTLIEQVVPGFNLLGTVLGAIAAPFGFVFGFLKGIVQELMEFLGLAGGGAMGAVAPLFQTISNAINLAVRSFSLFAQSGERLGESFAKAILFPFELVGRTVTSIWQRTIETIRGILRPFADFVQHIGQLLISFLAEASPGPTYWIRTKWATTVQFLQGLFERLKMRAIAVGRQLSSIFTSVLPQLPNAIGVATVLAELSGLINPIEGLTIAIANTIFGGVVESMGKSLDQVIPIFIRRLALITTFGGFIAQRMNFIQPLQARIIAGVAILTSLSTLYFKNFSADVTNIWHFTVQAIKGDLQALAGLAKNIGLLLISFLAEASPGPTYWIRTKWAMTVQFLQELFRRISAAANLVNQAFLGIGDVTADERIVAQQTIFENVILTLVSGVKSLFYVGQALTWVYDTLQETVTSAIANFDLLGFSLLTVASLPATMVPLLREGFERVIPELTLLAGRGIPRAIVFGLPGAISLAMSSGLVKGFEQGFANFLAETPARSAAFSHAVYGMFNQGLKDAVNQGLSEGVTAFVRAMPSELGGRADFEFNFDFDQAYAAYEEQRNARVIALVNYLKQVGDTAREVGAQLQAALAPILSFQLIGIPVIPFFAVILPFRDAVLEIAASPAVQGFISFLAGTVLPTAARTLAAIATTITFIFNTFVTLPIAAAINVLTREAVGAIRAIIQAGIAFARTIPGILMQAVVTLATTTVNAIALALAQIPFIGQALSQAFLGSISFLVATSQVYFQLLVRSFQVFVAQIDALIGPAYKQLARQVFQGIVYAFDQGIKPIASILTNLIIRAVDPRTSFRFLTLYFRTGGFRQVFKPGLFAINPIDLLFGGMGPLSQALTAGFKLALGVAFPANIISSKQAEVFQILADPLSKAKAARFGLMVKLVDVVESLPPALRPVLELLKGLMLISPIVQIIGRLAIATMFWYSILKPLNPEIYQAIESTQVLGISMAPVANMLRVMRFVFVDMGEALIAFAHAIPPFARATQQLFNSLGTTVGVVVHEAVGITSILLNLFKATFGNLFLLVSIGFAEALKFTLVNMQWWASFLRLKTQQYGDAIVAALHGHLGPLIHQVFSDIAQGVSILFQRTVGVAARAIASLAVNVAHFIGATFQEIGRLIRDPIGESIRLLGLFQDAVNNAFGGILATVNNYIQQLQLDRLVRFLGHFWIQLAAIADVLLLVTGVLNPLQFLITALIGLGLFLVNEYRTGFQTLDAIIAGLAHPIEFVTNAINAMIGALGVYIPPELTQFIAGVTEQFVKSLPIITGGVFLLALLIRKNIGQAFQDVVGGVMKIVSGVMQAVEATRLFGGAIRDTATSAQTQTTLGAQVHQVRRRETFLGIRNPFAYSQNEEQQRRAVALGDERVAKSRGALQYQKEIEKAIAEIEGIAEAQIRRMAKSKSAEDRIRVLGGTLQRDDGFSYEVAPLLEKRRNRWGIERMELTETARAKIAKEARSLVQTGKSSFIDGDISSKYGEVLRMSAANTSGLASAYVQHGGSLPLDEVLKALAKQGDYGITNLLSAFQKAMENLHVADFQVDKLYVAEFLRPKDFPVQTPYNAEAFAIQLSRFRANPIHANKEVIKRAKTAPEIQAGLDKQLMGGSMSYSGMLEKFRTELTEMFKTPQGNSAVVAPDILEGYAKRLAGKFGINEQAYQKERNIIIDELIHKQAKYISQTVGDFNKLEEANIEALKQAQRNIQGFHPIATNADVLTQAVRNVAGQTQSDMEQLNKTRGSLFSALFGFTGIPQLIENFQYNRRLFRRSQRISRRVEELARGESRERASAAVARQRGLEALMSNTGYGFPDQSAQFYAAKQINAQEQAFIESWVKNRTFKIDITQHQAFRQEADSILKQFQGLSTSLTFNTIEDVKKFQQLLTEKIPEKERDQLKKLEQFILHGAAQQPRGDQLSFADRDRLLEVINKTIGTNLQAFGVAGQYQEISKVNLNNLRDKYNDTVNRLMSRFIGNGQLVAEIGGRNEYIEGAYLELQRKLGLGKATGASLRQIQDVKFKNSVRQIGVNFGLFVQDVEGRVTEFRDDIHEGLDNFQGWLESTLPFPSLAPRIVETIRRPFEVLSNNIEAIYAAQKTNIQNTANQLRADFVSSNLVARINRLNASYKEAREASLQTILQSSKDERIANLARRNAATGQLGKVWESLNKQQFSDAQSGQAVTALMRGAMSEQAVRAMLEQELRRQGISKERIPEELDKIINRVGQQARYSVGDILKMRGLDASKVSKALESALSLEAKAVKQILTNRNYTARAVAPFQLFLVREIPGIIKDTAKGFVGTLNRFGGGAIARLATVVAKDIAIGFKGEFLNTLATSVKTIGDRLAVGANELAVGMERVVGRNPLSNAVRGFSDFLRARGKATADFLKAQALAPDDTRSLTGLIKNRTIELFKAIGSTLQSAQAAIQAQGGGIFGAIRALFGGLKGFFGRLFNRQQRSSPEINEIDAQIEQQRKRIAQAELRHANALERQVKAQSVIDQRVDPWVRDEGRNALRRQQQVARVQQAEIENARFEISNLERRRSIIQNLTERFSDINYSPIAKGITVVAGSVMTRIGKVYEGAATKLGQRVTELRGQHIAIQRQEIAAPGQGEAHQYQPKPGGGFFTRNIKVLSGLTTSYDEYIQPLTTRIFTKLTSSAHATTLKLSNYFKGAALRSQTAWEESANAITGKSWWSMVKRAVWTGAKIVANLNHAAADTTAAAWNRSEQSVSTDMHQMAQTAQATGQQMSQSMEQSAQKSSGFFSHLGNSIGKVGKAGMAIGAGVAATGFGLQTAAYSLSTLGFISEETSQELNKFFEIFTLLGAVGGILTPVLTALFSSFGAIGSIALTAASGIAAIGGAIAPLVGLGGVAFAPFLLGIAAVGAAFGALYLAVRSNFLGIGSLIQGVGHLLGSVLAGPIGFIESAWQGFVDRFGSKLMPIIQPALDIAQGLINALNHNPTEKIPTAWEIAGQRIKGVLDSILGAGQAVGTGLVSFFTPIVSLFNPIAKLFGKRPQEQQQVVPPEAAATQEKPEEGVFGSIMKTITSLVMLPVNLIKGLADWVGGVIAGVINGVVSVIVGPLQLVAEALRPLQMPIAMIELFFKNLVSIVQSVTYLNAMMRPLAADAIGINATINEIAKFFYNLRSLVESAEFLYYHVFNRKALALTSGQGGGGVDPSRLPSNYRGHGAPRGYEATGGKAIQDLSLGEAVGEVKGVFKNVMSIKENVGSVFGGFKTGLNWLGSAWNFTMGMIKGETGTLVADAEVQGYNLQKNLSEGSPGPTFWIRQNWEKTTKALQGWMGDLSGESKKTGQDIATNLAPDPVTPTPTISPVVDSPRQATGFAALKANAIAAVNSITEEVQAKYEVLQRGGIGNIGSLFLPGLSQTIRSVGILAGDFWDFGKRATVALATLNFGELSDAVKDFGGNFAYFTSGVLSGFKQMSGGAIAFGLYAFTSISPFLIILGGVAFTAAVIVANFLGLRTILGGVFRVGIGLGQMLVAVLGGLINVVRSLGMIVGGVFLAMRGDFSLLDQGIALLKASFQEMGRELLVGFRTIKSGVAQILRGIQEGITQLFPMFPEWIGQLKVVALAFRDPERAGEMVAEVLIGAFNRLKRAISSIPALLKQIPAVLGNSLSAVLTKVEQLKTRIWHSINQVYQFFQTLTFTGIVERIITEFRGLPQFLASIPGQLLARIEQAIPALKAPFDYLRGFARGFVRRLAAELPPDVVQAMSAAITAGAAKIQMVFIALSSRIVSIFRRLAATLGVEEHFNRTIQAVSDRWNRFIAFIKQGNLFAWVPRTTQEFSALFISAVSRVEQAWNQFTQWLSNTSFFSNLFAQIEKLSQRFTQGMEWLGVQWLTLQEKLSVPNLFAAFFERLRGFGDAFSNTIIWLEEKWRNFATRFNLPVFQGVFDNLWALGERFKQLVTFIENKWNQLASFLSTTPIVGWVIRGVESLGQTFTKVIQFVQRQWVPFVSFLSSSNLFPSIFNKLREFGAFIPQLVERVKSALSDLPGAAHVVLNAVAGFFSSMGERVIAALANIGQYAQALYTRLPQPVAVAVDRIIEKWRSLATQIKSFLTPVVNFARRIGQMLVSALAENSPGPTELIRNLWKFTVKAIIKSIEGLVAPVKIVGQLIVNTFRTTLNFVKGLFRGFYEAIAPGIERITQAVINIRKGAAAAGELSRVMGLGASLARLKDALDPLYRGLLKFVEGLRLSTSNTEKATGAAQVLGRIIGKVTLFFLEFAIKVAPPLFRVLRLILGLTIEVVAFAAKVAYALRFVASYFTRVGFAAVDTTTSIFRFFRSVWTASDRLRGAAAQLSADIEKFVVNLSAGLAELGRALRRLVGAFLDVFAPQLKPVLKGAIADFESFVSLVRFAFVDLISTTVQNIQQFYNAVRGLSPFEAVSLGAKQAKEAIASFGDSLRQIVDVTGVTKALAPLAQLLGLTSQSAQDMGEAFKSSGAAISGTLAGVGTRIQEFFGNLLTRAKETIEPFVIYYRAALDDLGDRIRNSFPFQFLERGFKQIQQIGAFTLSTIEAGVERVGAVFRQVLVALKLDVPFDAGVAAVQRFGDEVRNTFDQSLQRARGGVEQVTDWIKQQFVALGEKITDVIAQVVAQIYVKLASIGDGFRAITQQVITQIGAAFDSVRAFVSKALQPYAPIIEALGDVLSAISKIGKAIIELIGDFSIFGINVGSTVGDVILSFGKATWAVADFAGKVLTPVGLIGIANAVISIAGAIKDLIVNVAVLVGEAVPALGRLGTAIKESLEAPLQAIGNLWANTIGKIQSAIAGLSSKSQAEGEQVAQAVGEAPARKSWQFWKRTTQAIHADVEAMTEQLQAESHDIQAAVSEGSPGPTFWIRQHWQKTTDFVRQRMEELGQIAKAQGTQINESLAVTGTGSVNTDGLKGGVDGISEHSSRLANTAQSLFTSLGSALSNFAPQLATPLFMVNDFVSAFFDIKKAIPEVKALIQGTESVAVASNAAIAVSEAAKGAAAGGAAAVQVEGAIAASTAKTTEATVVGGANTFMARTYGFLARAAQSAYANMIAPLIPLLPWIIGISAVLFLFYQGFKTNFLGMGDAIKGVIQGIREFFGLLFSGAWNAIASIFVTIERQVQLTWRTIQRIGAILIQPFRPILNALGVRGGQSPIVTAVNLILFPLRTIAGIINLIITLIGGFIRGIIEVGGVILNFVLLPLRVVWAVIGGIVLGVNTSLSRIGSAINHFLALPMAIANGVLMQVARVVVTIGQRVINFVLAPFYLLEQILTRTIAPIINAILQALGAIAITIGVIVGGFILVSQAGAIFLGIIGLIQAGVAVVWGILTGIAAVGSVLMGILGFIGGATIPAIIAAILPFLPIIATVIAGAFLIKTAFDIVVRIVQGVVQGLGSIFNEVFGVLLMEIGNIWQTLLEVGRQLIEPFRPLMELLGIGKGGGDLFGGAIRLAIQAILIPVRIFTAALIFSIRMLSLVIQSIIRVGGFLFNLLLTPLRLVQSVIVGVVQAFSFLGQILYSIFVTPFQQLWGLIQRILGAAQSLPLIGRLFGGGQPRDTNAATNIQKFGGGGLVKGTGNQEVPVIAHAGEFVVTPEATRANLGVLEYLNAGGKLALPAPSVGIMPPMPLALPTPAAVPTEGTSGGTVVIENVNLSFEVQIHTNNGAEAGDEFLRYIEDPRFKRAVRQALRETVERMK